MTTNEERESARRAAFYDRGFTVGALKFRPVKVAMINFARSFGVEYLVGENLGKMPQDADKVFEDVMVFAWALHADEEKVLDMCLDFEDATSATAKTKMRRALRKEVLLLKNRLDVDQLMELTEKIQGIFLRIMNLSVATERKKDAPDLESDAPGNS